MSHTAGAGQATELNSPGLNALTLKFSDRGLEKDFLEYYFQRALIRVRYALMLGFLLYAVFGLLDGLIIPDAKHLAWVIRYAIVCPYLLAVLAFTFSPYFKKVMQLTTASAILMAGSGITAMIALAGPPGNYLYYTGLILVIMFAYTFVNLRFIYASMVSWLLVGAYEMVIFYKVGPALHIQINNLFFFLSANIIGMFAAYTLESYIRRDFIQIKINAATIDQLEKEVAVRLQAE